MPAGDNGELVAVGTPQCGNDDQKCNMSRHCTFNWGVKPPQVMMMELCDELRESEHLKVEYEQDACKKRD